jgi:hypothetical protein
MCKENLSVDEKWRPCEDFMTILKMVERNIDELPEPLLTANRRVLHNALLLLAKVDASQDKPGEYFTLSMLEALLDRNGGKCYGIVAEASKLKESSGWESSIAVWFKNEYLDRSSIYHDAQFLRDKLWMVQRANTWSTAWLGR